MSTVPTVVLGDPDGERVELRVHSRAYPGGLRVFDHNWLNVEAVARTEARSWRFLMYLRAGDFADFATEVQALRGGRRHRAEFASIDGWLSIEIAAGEPGAYTLVAYAREGHTEKVAHVAMARDESAIERLNGEIRAVVEAYPVKPGIDG